MFRSLVRTDPWKHSGMDRISWEPFRMLDRMFGSEELAPGDIVPRTNIVEQEGEYEVSLDLPGVKPEDVEVELQDGSLWVSGHMEEEQEEKGKTFHRLERHTGSFHRVLPLPGMVDEDHVVANFEEGVLKITLPKTEARRGKQIEVNS